MKAWTKAWLWMTWNQVMWQWISHLSALLHLPSRSVVNKSTRISLLAWRELVYSYYHGHTWAAVTHGFLGESLFSVKLFPELQVVMTMGQSKRNIMVLMLNSYLFVCLLKLKGEHYGNCYFGWHIEYVIWWLTAGEHLVLGTSEKDAKSSVVGNHERIKPKRKFSSESQWEVLNFSLEASRLLFLPVIICLVLNALALVVQIRNTKHCCKPCCILIVSKSLQ